MLLFCYRNVVTKISRSSSRWAAPTADVWRPFRLFLNVVFVRWASPIAEIFRPSDDGLHPSLIYFALSGLFMDIIFCSMGFTHRCYITPLQGSIGIPFFFDGLHPSLVYFALSGLYFFSGIVHIKILVPSTSLVKSGSQSPISKA